MIMRNVKCHGHECPDKTDCPLYSMERVKDDGDSGNNEIDCEVRRFYGAKIR
ncbi:hypothetical protein [Parabacteroides sp.]|jgi:hypothetical protein|uniref:hypothetical protein n=1 Tax=Parabacteroides sp. TaxID=1869337 RepID=UPI0025794F9C|nr:hypothetical protein [Parabacteroides sp.]